MFSRCFAVLFGLIVIIAGGPALAGGVHWELEKTITPPEKPLDVSSSVDGSRIYVLTDGGQVRIYDQAGELTGTIPVDPDMDRISAVGMQSAGLAEKIILSGFSSGKVQELALQFAVSIDTEGSPFLGRADAPVEIVEFSDFQCPYCARVKPMTEEILRQYPDQVKVVFKNFPLSSHEHAKPAALAAMAAQNQGKFWEFHDELFAAQRELSRDKIMAIARDLDLDMNQFQRDIRSRELSRRLQKDMQDGQQAGVRGTPTIFVNGMLLEQRNAETLRGMVEDALKK